MAPRTGNLDKAGAADLNPDLRDRRMFRAKLYALRAFLKSGGRASSVDRLKAALAPAIARQDWPAALAIVREWAAKAERDQDAALLKRTGNDLRRLGDYPRAFEWIAKGHAGSGPKEWTGSDLANRTLLIERREGDLGSFFSSLSTVQIALQHAARCIILVDPRLVPLYRRSFPGLDVRVEHQDEAQALADADLVASFEMLAHHLRWDARQSARLLPDPELVREFRSAHRARADAPVLGIAWGSVNKLKDTPRVDDWARLLRRADRNIVSLQYGDVMPAVQSLDAASGKAIFVDDTVDQLKDMDRFAAQLCSVDSIVTISNTIAHAAGALGVATIVLLDERFEMAWPATGRYVSWYDSITLLRKDGQGWASVMDEAYRHLTQVPSL